MLLALLLSAGSPIGSIYLYTMLDLCVCARACVCVSLCLSEIESRWMAQLFDTFTDGVQVALAM